VGNPNDDIGKVLANTLPLPPPEAFVQEVEEQAFGAIGDYFTALTGILALVFLIKAIMNN